MWAGEGGREREGRKRARKEGDDVYDIDDNQLVNHGK